MRIFGSKNPPNYRLYGGTHNGAEACARQCHVVVQFNVRLYTHFSNQQQNISFIQKGKEVRQTFLNIFHTISS